jgi:hypothetical protein
MPYLHTLIVEIEAVIAEFEAIRAGIYQHVKKVIEANKEQIIKWNHDQLQQGENAQGIELYTIGGTYSPAYLAQKIRKGKAKNAYTINLDLTGQFYESWTIRVMSDHFTITANDKIHGDSLYIRWKDVTGLNAEHLAELTKLVTDGIATVLKGGK